MRSIVCVSILALPFGRALPLGFLIKLKIIKFQSSPSLSEGRYRHGAASGAGSFWFQSSPSLSEGRYRRIVGRDAIVSVQRQLELQGGDN